MVSSVLDHKWSDQASVRDAVASGFDTWLDVVLPHSSIFRPVAGSLRSPDETARRIRGGDRDWLFEISPGSVRIRSTGGAGWERARLSDDEIAQGVAEIERVTALLDRLDVAAFHAVHDGADPIVFEDWYWSRRVALVDRLDRARTMLGLRSSKGRGAITKWTRASRSRMVRRVASLDLTPLDRDEVDVSLPALGAHETARLVMAPCMVTLTYPGDWLSVCPDAATLKRHLAAFRRAWERQFGPAPALWKLEFQERGAPHVHLLLRVPETFLRVFLVKGDPVPHNVRVWARLTWARIVGATGQDRIYHERAGVSFDHAEGGRYTDPQRAAVYFSKHGAPAFGAKEYQHRPPEAWALGSEGAGGCGRFWGYWRLSPVEIHAPIAQDDALEAARILRGWVRAQGKRSGLPGSPVVPRRRRVARKRIDHRTGVVRIRLVSERYEVRGLAGARPGGFVLANDAPALARQIGRALSDSADWPPGQRRPLP